MKRALLLAPLMLATACTPHSYATCENARITILLAQRAADRFCPMEARR